MKYYCERCNKEVLANEVIEFPVQLKGGDMLEAEAFEHKNCNGEIIKISLSDLCLCGHPLGHHIGMKRRTDTYIAPVNSCGTCKCLMFEIKNSENCQKNFIDYRNYRETIKNQRRLNGIEYLNKIRNFQSKLHGSLEYLNDVQLFTLLADNEIDELSKATRTELKNRGRRI